MEQKEINALLETVNEKTASAIKAELDAFKEAFKSEQSESLNESIKAEIAKIAEKNNEDLEGLKDILAEHGELLKEKSEKKVASKSVSLKTLISDNLEEIATVQKGKSVQLSVKAVGDMTLTANLTGDQPREYSNTVVTVPGQMINVADLVENINITGGVYTYPQETGSEGSISQQTEGASKSQIDYDLTMADVTTEYIAGYCVYSKKMRNNLPFLETFIPNALRRDYAIAENSAFNTVLASSATASTEIITGKNKIEMLINEVATLEGNNHVVNGIVVRPSDFYDILKTEKSTGAGYGLPGVVNFDNGVLTINGIPVYKATWLTANKYFVGDWTRVKKVTSEGLGVEFSAEDSDNFRKNNITARVESQTAITLQQTSALVYGDFTAI